MHIGNVIRVVVPLIWLATFGLYLRFEAYPVWFTRTVPGYRGMLPDALLTRETWARILIDGIPAGYAHTTLTMNDDEPEPVLEIASRIHIRAKILNQIQRIQLSTDVTLDQDYHPVRFSAFAAAGDFSLRIMAEHEGHRQFRVTTETAGTTTTRTIVLPPDTVFHSPLHELAVQQLRPGRSLVIRTIDPISLRSVPIIITAGNRETILIGGVSVRALPLVANWQGIELRSWVGDDGTVLRQETPFGWILESASSADALAAVSDQHTPPQLLRGMGTLSFLQTLIGAGRETPP